MTSIRPYPTGTAWRFASRTSGYEFNQEIVLLWEADGSPMTDEYLPEEISAAELWKDWVHAYGDRSHKTSPNDFKPGHVPISWFVISPPQASQGVFEAAPFQSRAVFHGYKPDDFLTSYTHPQNSRTGEPVNWLRLRVVDRGWNKGTADKGGFVQEATGWKPSPLQATMDVRQIARASGAYVLPL